MQKRISVVLVLAFMLSLLSGCSVRPSDPERTLRIAVSPDFAPLEFVDPSRKGQDQFVGFDIMLAEYIASELNLELEIMPMEFNSCQMAVFAGTVDLSISGYTWNAKREADFNLSNRYFVGNGTDEQYLITLSENAGRFTDVNSLEGVRVAVQSASLQQILAQEQLPGAEIHVFYDLKTAVRRLLSGDFDCIAVSAGNGESILTQYPEIVRSGFNFEVDDRYRGYVILLQKGNDALTERVNEILASAEPYFDDWYAQARAIAGIEVRYDENGNAITTQPEE